MLSTISDIEYINSVGTSDGIAVGNTGICVGVSLGSRLGIILDFRDGPSVGKSDGQPVGKSEIGM